MSLLDDLFSSDGMGTIHGLIWIGLGIWAIIGLVISLPVKRKDDKIKELEMVWPDVLADLAEELRAGMGVESALDAIASSRNDRMGAMLKDTVNRMRDDGFGLAMTDFAKKTGSPMISRIVSILNIALSSSGSFATTLENISEEYWEIYMLRKERITKTQGTANFILWGGSVICPILLGLIVAVFGSGKAGSFTLDIDLSMLNQSMFFYMMVLGAGGVWMQSVILQTTKTAMWRMPIYMFLATTTLILALKISIV
ncbi:MAG: type II secretion system F family protein [Candidatus Thermoplasmatota archaeon]|jgi:archaellum biogenesis protein FlaJ (TadC family)|nr:type II secretion system F family protein [Candidatus Thermoplasmatota archaeon]MEC9332737.1 type II secretion system F family protein [Candidatus Thermoplasmatota archaeon]MED6306042.1 type II secretion system F family protein [Candidatus Thermoplasmatota archaeon]